MPEETETRVPEAPLNELKPFFSVYVIECIADDFGLAFNGLVEFLEKEAVSQGRAENAEIVARTRLSQQGMPQVTEPNILSEFGFDELHAVIRARRVPPGWASKHSGILDVVNELTLSLRRSSLVAIRTDIVSSSRLHKWLNQPFSKVRALNPDVLANVFDGDGKMLWLQGVHRQRKTKPNTKAIGGTRLQDAIHFVDDSTYVASALTVEFVPDEGGSLKGNITVSPDKSKLSFKAMAGLRDFLIATDEALGMIEKAIASEDPPEVLFPELAVRERDLSRVFGAFDIRVATPEEVAGSPDVDDSMLERAELLRGAVFEVSGDERSAAATLTVGLDRSRAGKLKVEPVAVGSRIALDVRLIPSSITDTVTASTVRDCIADGELLSIYYESGHCYSDGRVTRANLDGPPFNGFEFCDFTGYSIVHEKPRGVRGDQRIHSAIGKDGDDSVFAWVVANYDTGYLICDDGSGEVADFLHLKDDGHLSVIHVKGADSLSAKRGIAVTAFEEVVSQAVKGIQLVRNDSLISQLSKMRVSAPAAWIDGVRVDDANPRKEFLDRLQMRVRSDRTTVVIVQPHILESSYNYARTAAALNPDANSRSLNLLDTLLHSTRQAVHTLWDDLKIIGCQDPSDS